MLTLTAGRPTRRNVSRALRASALLVSAVAALALGSAPAYAHALNERAAAPSAGMTADFDVPITSLTPQRHRAAVTRLVNDERTRRGLPALVPSSELERSARPWAIVTRRGYGILSHGDFADRALRFPFVMGGARGRRFVGENLGFGSGEFSTPREIVEAWMNSPGHRANILRNWRYGAVWSSRSGDAVAVVQHFGRNR